MSVMVPGEKLRRYLGDGVYVSHDGHQVWLRTQEGMAIALDVSTYDRLTDWVDAIMKHMTQKAWPEAPEQV